MRKSEQTSGTPVLEACGKSWQKVRTNFAHLTEFSNLTIQSVIFISVSGIALLEKEIRCKMINEKNSVKWPKFVKTFHHDFEQAWLMMCLTILAYCDNFQNDLKKIKIINLLLSTSQLK